jgi:hypothetical protein
LAFIFGGFQVRFFFAPAPPFCSLTPGPNFGVHLNVNVRNVNKTNVTKRNVNERNVSKANVEAGHRKTIAGEEKKAARPKETPVP